MQHRRQRQNPVAASFRRIPYLPRLPPPSLFKRSSSTQNRISTISCSSKRLLKFLLLFLPSKTRINSWIFATFETWSFTWWTSFIWEMSSRKFVLSSKMTQKWCASTVLPHVTKIHHKPIAYQIKTAVKKEQALNLCARTKRHQWWQERNLHLPFSNSRLPWSLSLKFLTSGSATLTSSAILLSWWASRW